VQLQPRKPGRVWLFCEVQRVSQRGSAEYEVSELGVYEHSLRLFIVMEHEHKLHIVVASIGATVL
jgi:hypothetical protein